MGSAAVAATFGVVVTLVVQVEVAGCKDDGQPQRGDSSHWRVAVRSPGGPQTKIVGNGHEVFQSYPAGCNDEQQDDPQVGHVSRRWPAFSRAAPAPTLADASLRKEDVRPGLSSLGLVQIGVGFVEVDHG